jgi:WD40 repeat protein
LLHNKPAGVTAGHEPSKRYKYLLLKNNSTRPEFDPFPQTFQVLNGHTGKVCSLSVTPDGQHLISCSNDETCILWDLNTGEALKILKGHTGKVKTVSITPDGQRAISGSDDKTCILWNLNTGEAIQILTGHTKSVIVVSITPDGKRAISCDSGNVFILWDLNACAILKTLKGDVDFSKIIYITPDCRWAITAALMENACMVWDLVSGKVVHTLKGHSDTVNAVSITPDGHRAFSGSTDGKCILWDLSTGKLLRCLKGKGPYISALSITANGKLAVSGYYNKTCILWNLATGQPLQTLIGHNDLISAISITPDGQRVISGSEDGTCIVWNLNIVKKSRALQGHNDKVTFVCMAYEGRRAISISKDYKCLLWDLLTGEALPITKENSESRIDRVYENIFPIAGYNNIILTIQEINTFKPIETIKGRASYASITSFTPDGKLRIDASSEYTSVVKNIKTGKILRVLEGHYVCITPDGQRAISIASDFTCILWDLSTGESLHSLEGHNDSINEVSITPDGQRAITCSNDRTCIIWDLNTGKKISIFVSNSGINTITWFPGGLFGGTSNKILILNGHKDLLCPQRIIVTIRQIIDVKKPDKLKYYAECPVCGNRFKPQSSVLAYLKTVRIKANLKSDQSPCFELSKEIWNDPVLHSICPKCKEQLKFNPFIFDEDEFSALTIDERFLLERLWLKTSLRDAFQRE